MTIEELKQWVKENSENGKRADAIRELIAISELKGEQVPVGKVTGWDKHLDENIISWTEEGSELPMNTELFTAPQHLVVSMALFDGYQPHIVRELQAAFKMAIEAAGGIVKVAE